MTPVQFAPVGPNSQARRVNARQLEEVKISLYIMLCKKIQKLYQMKSLLPLQEIFVGTIS